MRSIIFLACLLFAVAAPAQSPPRATAPLLAIQAGQAAPRLERAAIAVERAGGQVRTTLEMTFHNSSGRTLEGTLQFPLEPGQQVVSFALDVDGRMRDAVPVEKARGRQVLEAIERHGADPGLLEQSQGEFFRLRVYPFPPQGRRSVRIVLAEPLLANGRSLRLPVAFATGLDELPLSVRASAAPHVDGLLRPLRFASHSSGTYTATLRPADVPAGRAPRLLFSDADTAARVQVQTHDGARYFSAELPVAMGSAPRALPSSMTLLWDSSASGTRRAHDLEFALLDTYFSSTPAIDVELVRFRDALEAPVHFRIRQGDWSALHHALEATVYDGATSLRGWTPPRTSGDVLLFTDGLFNYGDVEVPDFAPGSGLYTVRAGVAGNAMHLAALAESRGGDAITIEDAAALPAARARLLREWPRIVRVNAFGAADVEATSVIAHDGVLRVAGRITDPSPRVTLDLMRGGDRSRVEVPLDTAVEGSAAASLWAQYRVAALMAAPGGNRASIARLGTDFGIVTPDSSLIVLERVEDYVRYGIAPPDELRETYTALTAKAATRRDEARVAQLDAVRAQWRTRIEWWSTRFPKDAPPPAPEPKDARTRGAIAMDAPAPVDVVPLPMSVDRVVAAPPPAPALFARQSSELDSVVVTGSRIANAASASAAAAPSSAFVTSAIGIHLQPWTPDSPFARRLRALDADAAYAAYLDERKRDTPGTAFYLDVAHTLFERHREDLALRVLSNLAEMDLDNRYVLRVLGYRLMQAKRPDLAAPVLEAVLAMGDDEPQSYRDLALARAALGERQRAVDLLYEVVAGSWDGRFPGIEMTALAELNALVATSPTPLDVHRVPDDLRRNLPLDLRAVLSWDADATDMDLWVTDPNGEKVFYEHPASYQGGRLSADFTGGYGPEEFALRTAKPGRYTVEANYFGDRQQVVTGAPTLQLWLSTRFGTLAQKDQRITLRLRDPKETILVGEFEVK